MNPELPEIVRRAMTETVVNIGQLTASEQRTLDRYVEKGWLSKGKGGPYPILKTVWAFPGYDFALWRQRYVDHLLTLARLDEETARQRAAKG